MMRSYLFLLLFVALPIGANAQTRITTSAGNVYFGSVISEDGLSVRLMTTDSIEVTLTRDKISKVEYNVKPVAPNITGSSQSQDHTDHGSYTGGYGYRPLGTQPRWDSLTRYFSIGASLGTPAALHLLGGYHSGRWSYRFSAGYLSTVMGAQLNIGRAISQSEETEFVIGVAGGYSLFDARTTAFDDQGFFFESSRQRTWLFVGPYVEISLSGLFAEVSLSAGTGDFTIPQLGFQVGYAYRFDRF